MNPTRVFVLAIAGLLAVAVAPGEAGGPWQAQIVDAETGQPLEGVVVLLAWHKMTRTPGGPSPDFWDAEEAVTGPDGRFRFAARRTFTLNPIAYIDGPEVTIFKPGYGDWRARDPEKKPPDWEERSAGQALEIEGVVLELRRLGTREERLGFYGKLGWSGFVPGDRTKRLREAIQIERAYLGFGK